MLVRAVHLQAMYLGGRKLSKKGQRLTDEEMRKLFELQTGAVRVGRLAFKSGALEALDDDGKVVPFEDLEVLFGSPAPAPEEPTG